MKNVEHIIRSELKDAFWWDMYNYIHESLPVEVWDNVRLSAQNVRNTFEMIDRGIQIDLLHDWSEGIAY